MFVEGVEYTKQTEWAQSVTWKDYNETWGIEDWNIAGVDCTPLTERVCWWFLGMFI